MTFSPYSMLLISLATSLAVYARFTPQAAPLSRLFTWKSTLEGSEHGGSLVRPGAKASSGKHTVWNSTQILRGLYQQYILVSTIELHV